MLGISTIISSLTNALVKHSLRLCKSHLHVHTNAFHNLIAISRARKHFTRNITLGMASNNSLEVKPQKFDYFLVLDFEATCEKDVRIRPQEIIEFPVLMINSQTLETEAVFHQYVQPRVHRELTPFCIELTGIIQSMVDGQPHIEDVLKDFQKWMEDKKLLDPSVKSLFVTCGDWDLKTMLPSQAEYFNIPTPGYFNNWLNIKKAYADVQTVYPKGMMNMLEGLNLRHQGRHHSGIDDCKNIAEILRELLRRGYVAKVTGSSGQE